MCWWNAVQWNHNTAFLQPAQVSLRHENNSCVTLFYLYRVRRLYSRKRNPASDKNVWRFFFFFARRTAMYIYTLNTKWKHTVLYSRNQSTYAYKWMITGHNRGLEKRPNGNTFEFKRKTCWSNIICSFMWTKTSVNQMNIFLCTVKDHQFSET